MIRLEDFDDAVLKEKRNNPDSPDPDEIALLLQKAARDLLFRQAIHADDNLLKTSYRLIRRHIGYYESLFDGLGYTISHDSSFGYILLLPGDIKAGSRRDAVTKEETLLLFALRVLWEEAAREGDMDELGRIETDTEILFDRFTAMSEAEFPKKPKLKERFAHFRARGILRVGDEDKHEEITQFTILPTIRELVTPDLAEQVQTYIDGHSSDDDVFEHIETQKTLSKDVEREEGPKDV